MSEKPADTAASADKPCCKRVLINGAHPSWCIEPCGHDGTCRGVVSGSPPTRNDFLPKRTA